MTTTELSRYIAALADYALEKQLIAPEDEAWAVNSLLAAMGAREFVPPAEPLRAPLLQQLVEGGPHRLCCGAGPLRGGHHQPGPL